MARKIPNINTHIFKQPRLPWSEALVSVSDVSVNESSGVYSLSYTYDDSNTNDEGKPWTYWESITISGTLEEGEVLTAAVLPAGTYTYQWYRADDNQETNDAAISGATAATHTLVSADISKRLRVEATDSHGDVYSSYYTAAITSGSTDIHIGFRDSVGAGGAPTALSPASAINDCNANVSNGAIADLVDIDNNATGFGLTLTNFAAISGLNVSHSGDTTTFTEQTKNYMQYVTGTNEVTITIDGVDDADTFTIRVIHFLNNGASGSRDVTVSAGGASGTQKTYDRDAYNNTTEDELTGLTTDGAGNLIIKWKPRDSSGDTAPLNAMAIITE